MNKYIKNKYITLDPGLKTAIEKINDNYIKKSELNELLRKITVTADNKDIVIKVGIPQVDENGLFDKTYKEVIIDLKEIWDERKIKEVVGADENGLPNVPKNERSENKIYIVPQSSLTDGDSFNRYIEYICKDGTWEELGTPRMSDSDVYSVLYTSDYATPDTSTMKFIVLSGGSYNKDTKVPNIDNPDKNTIYLVPDASGTTNNFIEWIYIDENWERLGSPTMTSEELEALIRDI